MSQLELIVDYKDNEKYRKSFNELATATFGIDFEPWFQKGFWNERYICYSYADGDQVVANVSINKLDIMWEGERKKAIQIGTVMTHPDYRKRGLASSLMQKAIDDHEEDFDFIYLFGNNHALSMYLKCGFKPIVESQFSMALNSGEGQNSKLRKLDMSNAEDLKLICQRSSERAFISERLGVTNDQHLILFYCLYVLSDNIYYLEEEETIVLFSVEGTELHLYDVLSEKSMELEQILSKITVPEVEKVVFHFTPSLESHKVDVEPLETEDRTLLIKPLTKEITEAFLFPAMSHA